MKKLLFLYNTHAGKGLLKSSQIRRLFRVLDEGSHCFRWRNLPVIHRLFHRIHDGAHGFRRAAIRQGIQKQFQIFLQQVHLFALLSLELTAWLRDSCDGCDNKSGTGSISFFPSLPSLLS